jgi:aryl-alcohol dehydrogenase-like predicted oxidoreductase
MAELIEAGKVRHWGLSNYDAAGTQQVLSACDAATLPRPVVQQPAFSLLNRGIEADLLPLCRRESIAVVPYRTLEGGLLSGKYGPHAAPPGSRGAEQPSWVPGLEDRETLQSLATLEAAAATANQGLFEYVLRQSVTVPGITSLILGVSRVEQLESAVRALSA